MERAFERGRRPLILGERWFQFDDSCRLKRGEKKKQIFDCSREKKKEKAIERGERTTGVKEEANWWGGEEVRFVGEEGGGT